MSDEPKKRSKRGRPAKNPEKKQRKNSDSLSSLHDTEFKKESKIHNRMLENYYELHSRYLKDGISQQVLHLITNLAQSNNMPESAKTQPLLSYLSNISQEFYMNELEIVVLGIYLDRFGWSDKGLTSEIIIRYTSYAAKEYLSENMSPVNSFISFKYPGFIENYYNWIERFKGFLIVSPKDLNDKFKEISRADSTSGDLRPVDYNFYVDEILQTIPSSNYEKNHTEDVINDPSFSALFQAIKENKKILTPDYQEVPIDLLQKIERFYLNKSQIKKEVPELRSVFIVDPELLLKVELIHSDADEEEAS